MPPVRPWLVPLALGLLVAGATALLGPHVFDTAPAPPSTWEREAARGYVLPFPLDNRTGQSFLMLAPRGQVEGAQALARDHGAGSDAPVLAPRWLSGTVGLLEPKGTTPQSCPCVDARNGTLLRVTAYIFRAEGTLVASNDEPDRAARFVPDSVYALLPNATWHVGPGRPPAGVRELPEAWRPLAEAFAARLAGLGEGSVVSAAVLDHPHEGLLGPLYVTLRIDALAASVEGLRAAPA